MAVIQLVPSGTESGRDTDRSRATAVVSVIQDSDDPSDRMCSPVVMCAIENATIVFHSEDAGNVKDTSPPRNSRPETRRHPREMYLHLHRPGHSAVVLESVYARPRGRIGIMMIVILRKLEPGPALAGRVSSCAEGPSGGALPALQKDYLSLSEWRTSPIMPWRVRLYLSRCYRFSAEFTHNVGTPWIVILFLVFWGFIFGSTR